MNSRRKKPKRHPTKRKVCRALICVDSTAIRKKAKRAYEKTRADLDRARLEVDRFHSKDKPEFEKWLNSTFGRLLTEIRETGQKLEERRRLIFEVESEAYCHGISYKQAYRRVMERRENPPGPSSEESREFEESRPADEPEEGGSDTQFSDEFDTAWNEMDEAFESFFEEMFGFSPSDRDRPKPDSSSRPDPTKARVKNLYRAIVRRLHPDVQSKMSDQKLEWWHQTQEAYENNDADHLEMILTLCEIEESGTATHASVSVLTRITKQFRSTLRSIKREISSFRRDPAWNFSQHTNIDRLHYKIRRELETELHDERENLKFIERRIALWATVPPSKKFPARRKPPVQEHPEFTF